MTSYHCMFQNRDKYGGEVAIYYKNSLRLTILITTEKHEIYAIKIGDQIIATSYNPSNLNFDELRDIGRLGEKVVILGDLNASSKAWSDSASNANERKLIDNLHKIDMQIVAPDEPTRYSLNGHSTIGIEVTKNTNLTLCEVLQDLDSEHLPVVFEIVRNGIEMTDRKPQKYYDKADWTMFRNHITKNLCESPNTESTQQIDNSILHLTDIILDATERYIPRKKLMTLDLPSQEIQQLITNRNRFRRI